MPAPTDRRRFTWAIAAVIAFGIAGIIGMAHMIWAALEKVASGQGLETYRTFWLVEFNYVGFLVMVGAVVVALLLGGAHWLHEWWQVKSLENKYGSRESNT